jgi:hypothetical protein
MTVIDDITALLTPVLHTNTTKDITAAAVRAALVTAFTDIVSDVDTKTGALLTPVQTASLAESLSRQMVSRQTSLTDLRMGQPIGAPGTAGALARLVIYRTHTIYGGTGFVANAQLSTSDGVTVTTGVRDWGITDFFSVKPGGSITVSAAASVLFWYDQSKTFLSITNGAFTDGQVLTVPSTAAFAKTHSGAVAKLWILDGDATGYLPEHPWKVQPAYLHQVRPWAGRVWSIHGDSMAASRSGNSWFSDAAQYHGCKYAKDQSVDGGHASTLMEMYNDIGSARIPLTTGFFDDVDCVFVLVGTNDATLGTTVGDLSDATTATTFFGLYKKFIEFVLAYKPVTKMVLCTPLWTAGHTNALMDTYKDAIRAMAKFYAIKLWDCGEESQFNPVTYAAMSDDSLHPTYFAGNDLTVLSPPDPKWNGSLTAFGSGVRGLMHHVFPVDYVGDPYYFESYLTYTRPSI